MRNAQAVVTIQFSIRGAKRCSRIAYEVWHMEFVGGEAVGSTSKGSGMNVGRKILDKKGILLYIEESAAVAETACVGKVRLLEGKSEEGCDCSGRWCEEHVGELRTRWGWERTLVREIMGSACFGSF